MRSENLHPQSWSNGPGDIYAPHSHPYDKVLFVARGSIVWFLPETGEEFETVAGDRIELPRGVVHSARVGRNGVTCLEAHR
jgi:quercetin dioxygenase-like cupin family protein